MPVPRDPQSIEQHVAFAGELARWLSRAGVRSDDAIGALAVGFADILHGAAQAAPRLDALLAIDPTTPAGADAALEHLAHLHAIFVTEIKHHADDLARHWEELEAPLVAASPDDDPELESGDGGV